MSKECAGNGEANQEFTPVELTQEQAVLHREYWEDAVLANADAIEKSLRSLQKLGALSRSQKNEIETKIDRYVAYHRKGGEWHK